MNEIIKNTVNILSKISYSRHGFLLQLSDQGYKILEAWGGKNEDFEAINELLFQLFKVGGIDSEQVAILPPIKTFLKEKKSASFFIKDLIYFSELNLYVYVVLFSDNSKEFNEESRNRLIPVISILSHQIKGWYEEQNEKGLVASESQSDQKENKKLTDEWEKKFNILAKTSQDLIFILDYSGKIILINEAAKEFLQYLPEEMKGKYFLDFINKDDSTVVNMSLSKLLSEMRTVHLSTTFVTNYGQLRPVELSCSTITDKKKIIGVLGVGQDLSEKFRNDSELQKIKHKLTEINRLLAIERERSTPLKSVVEELNRLKSDFISGISHEFRTTLASIIGFSETIVSDPEITEAMKEEFIKVIMSEGKRLAKLINYFLDTTNTDEKIMLINKSSFELTKLIEDVVDANIELANEKNIIINFERPSEEIIIDADKESLFQVINALINNGIRYTEDLGRVKVIVNNFSNEVEIIVSDTGIGIPDQDQPYIFQRFFKASRRMSDIPSVGVGLVFVKQIIDLHKGLISIQSEIGSGTTFLVKLPKRSKIEKIEVKFE
jgi:PAS domain S-box-containing protein